jgi:hypothetical protein
MPMNFVPCPYQDSSWTSTIVSSLVPPLIQDRLPLTGDPVRLEHDDGTLSVACQPQWFR